MAQFLKVLTGSKLLFLPFTAVAVVGVGSFYVGGASALCYLFIRHNNYTPPTFTRLMQLAVEAATPAPPTSAAGLPLTGPLLTTSSPPPSRALPPNTVVAPPRPVAPPSRFQSMYNVVRVPARFYAVNLLLGAAVLGAGTSLGQRILCGRIPKKSPPTKQAKTQ